tara:strand:- start:210 stop:323 length:114 start_codon:yes stop_codon:yes gene_type:complete
MVVLFGDQEERSEKQVSGDAAIRQMNKLLLVRPRLQG